MRSVGHLESKEQAKELHDVLTAIGLEHEIEPSQEGGYLVWIHREEELERGQEILERYLADPESEEFQGAPQRAAERRAQRRKQEKRSRSNVIDGRTAIHKERMPLAIGPLTMVLIGISVALGIGTQLGSSLEAIQLFTITQFEQVNLGDRVLIRYQPGFPEVRHGEVWRLITPIFLHFHILHILFNMLWLKDLGTLIERKHSTWLLAAMVLIMGISSNIGQYLMTGPAFGGMSGVVYGLLGYIWIRGRFDPRAGYRLRQDIVYLMGIWYLLCFTGLIGAIANTAHTVGLVVGVAWGYLFSGHLRRVLRSRS
jgi:rhomboid protease GlpG